MQCKSSSSSSSSNDDNGVGDDIGDDADGEEVFGSLGAQLV